MEMSSVGATTTSLPLEEQSQVGEARRLVASATADLGFNERDRGRLALVATEIGSNAVNHATGGEFLLRRPANRCGPIEILVTDRGPGIGNLARALEDGFSTAGTPGTGLGAAARASDFFDIYSSPGFGTVVYARVQAGGPPRVAVEAASGEMPRMEWGDVCVAQQGETVCGDSWARTTGGEQELIMIADGLGHGPSAAAASREAVRVLLEQRNSSPTDILLAMHGALQSTRGAAVAVASLDHRNGHVRYAGIGNIAGVIASGSGETRSMVSHNGTVGHQLRKVHEFTYDWPTGATVIMHSDGLQTHWQLAKYPGLMARHPAIIAGILYRDFSRRRDDVTVLVVRAVGSERMGWS